MQSLAEVADKSKLPSQPPPSGSPLPLIMLDVHRHFSHSLKDYDGTRTGTIKPPFEWFKDDMDSAGIEKAFLISDAYLIHGKPGNAAADRRRYELNEELSGFISAHPNRFFGLCGINIAWKDRDDVLQECLQLPHMIGVKLHFEVEQESLSSIPTQARLETVLQIASRYHAVFLIHMAAEGKSKSEMSAFFTMAQKHPELTFILAHAGYGGWDSKKDLQYLATKCARPGSCDNIYTEVSHAAWDPKEYKQLAKTLRTFGIRKVLFGTDYPMLVKSSDEVRRFLKLPLTDQEKQAVLYQNGIDFLNRISESLGKKGAKSGKSGTSGKFSISKDRLRPTAQRRSG